MVTQTKPSIEVAFPVRKVSPDSVHEKNVRHGNISMLSVWRPLAESSVRG